MNYTNAFPNYHNPLTERITVIILGSFVFMSGLLVGKKAATGTAIFYKKRLIRIYPLYITAIILFWMTNISDGQALIKASIGLSMFYGPAPQTLWFITMLILFYILTPILSSHTESLKIYLTAAGLVLLSFAALYILSPYPDSRVIIYFPAFAAGIYLSNNNYLPPRLSDPSMVIIIITSITISIFAKVPELDFFSIPIATIFPILLCAHATKQQDNKTTRQQDNKIISIISYSGFTAYLIHRPIYTTIKYIYFPANENLQLIYLFAICLPIVMFIAWITQNAYDALISTKNIME